MKIVITGGLGFIGQHLAARLIAEDHDVLLIDSLSAQIHGELPLVSSPIGAKVIRMDICDLADRHELIEGAEVIFHLASETGTAQSMYQMSHYTRVNCEGTSSLLEAVAKCSRRPRQIVLASSRSVYGEGAYHYADNPGFLVTAPARKREKLDSGYWEIIDDTGRLLTAVATPESFPLSPGSIYAATKAAQEFLLSSASIALGVQTTIFRFQNVYGEGQSLCNPYTGIISIFFNRARQGLHIPIYEDGFESRDFVHVDDVVKVLTSSFKEVLPNGIIMNIGSGKSTSVLGLAEALLKVSGFNVPIQITGQYRVGDIRNCFADISLLKSYLGITPKKSLHDGLQSFCKWAVTQPVHLDQSFRAESELKEKGLAN